MRRLTTFPYWSRPSFTTGCKNQKTHSLSISPLATTQREIHSATLYSWWRNHASMPSARALNHSPRLDLPPLANAQFNVKETQMKMQMSRQSKRHFRIFVLAFGFRQEQWTTDSIVSRSLYIYIYIKRIVKNFRNLFAIGYNFCFRVSKRMNNYSVMNTEKEVNYVVKKKLLEAKVSWK